MPNSRISYYCRQLSIKSDGEANYTAVHGAQSANSTTTFNLEQVFELGQINIYDNIENLPDVEVTAQKVLDGYPLMWHLSTKNATSPTLAGRSTDKALIAFSIYPDTNDSATGVGQSEVEFSGMFPSQISYSFPVDGNFTEDMTWVGNNKVWANDSKMVQSAPWSGATTLNISGSFSSNNDAPIGSGGVNRRQNLIFTYNAALGLDTNSMVADPDCTILPPEIWGISNSGTNERTGGNYGAHLQGITISTSLGRDALNELGRRGPFTRPAQFPTEVTTEITAIATSGDMVGATEDGILSTGSSNACSAAAGNLRNRTIRIATCEGTRIYCGLKNKLSSVSMSGGDASQGSNVEVSYSYSNFNIMTVVHSGDPHSSGATWWTNRATYLVN